MPSQMESTPCAREAARDGVLGEERAVLAQAGDVDLAGEHVLRRGEQRGEGPEPLQLPLRLAHRRDRRPLERLGPGARVERARGVRRGAAHVDVVVLAEPLQHRGERGRRSRLRERYRRPLPRAPRGVLEQREEPLFEPRLPLREQRGLGARVRVVVPEELLDLRLVEQPRDRLRHLRHRGAHAPRDVRELADDGRRDLRLGAPLRCEHRAAPHDLVRRGEELQQLRERRVGQRGHERGRAILVAEDLLHQLVDG
jgi:hypothetical protein